jgi:exodeoxyribonuclease-3
MRPFDKTVRIMKIATFNANSIRARLELVLDWLRKESPDLLCLQETKVPDKDFPQKAFEDMHYHPVFRGEKSYNGVAIVSKKPLEDVKIGFDEYESEGTRLITAVINKIAIVNTYVPQGFHPLSKKFREKLDWLQRLYDYFNEHFRPDKPLLWVGDFNVAPEPEDVYDPAHLEGQIGFHPDERAALQRFRQWGFTDVFRLHQPGPGHYTFWDYRLRNAVPRNLGWRVDHIWATRPLAEKSTRAWIDMDPRLKEKPSDHTFVVAEFGK